MCVLQPCANPTGVGVWWRDDTKWYQYQKAHDSLIRDAVHKGLSSIDLGRITSTVHPKGARYTADLINMEQVAVSSGQRRPIKIIDEAASPPPQQISGPQKLLLEAAPSKGNASARVHYRDSSGQLHQYDQEIADALLRAVVGGNQRSLMLEHTKSRRLFHFDLDTMEERLVDDDCIDSDEAPRKVIIEVPWDPVTMMTLVKKAEGTMRRKILVMTVERFRSEEHLDATLPEIAYPRTVVSRKADKQSFPGHRSFEGFIDALEANLGASSTGIESFIELTIPNKDGRSSRVQLAFKPVDRKNTGANSKSMAFWRSMAPPIAAAHAVVCGTAMVEIMLYLILMPRAIEEEKEKRWRLSSCPQETEVMIDRPDHYLSLAQLSVS